MYQSTKRLASELHRWTEYVQRCANGMHRRVSQTMYETAYEQVLDNCAQCEPSQIVSRVESLVKPWSSLHTLRTAGRPILADVVQRAEALQSDLGGSSHRTTLAPRWLMFLALLLAGNALVFWFATHERVLDYWSRRFRVSFYDWQGYLANLSPLQQSAALAAVVVVFGYVYLKNTRTD